MQIIVTDKTDGQTVLQ